MIGKARPEAAAGNTRLTVVWLAATVTIAAGAVATAEESMAKSSRARAKVALTFDDLPVHGPVPVGRTRPEVVRDIIAALTAGGAPAVYGFVNASSMDAAPENREVLRLWREAGFLLGNHTFSHMDLHANTVADFERDVLANEPTLRSFMKDDADWHWFRFPYLRAGSTIEKRRGTSAMLRRHGYRVAEVTLSFGDWAYHEPYARCVAKRDQEALQWLEKSYMERAEASLDASQRAARAAFGRDIAHVMVLHVGAFNAVMLRPLLELVDERGFDLVTLDEAQSDEAYASEPEIAMPTGATLLDQVSAVKRIPGPDLAPLPQDRLDSLCR